MAFNGPHASAHPYDNDRWSYPSDNRPVESFTAIKGPDPLSGNWTYDSAIDLFSMNNMMPDPFAMDLPSDPISLDPAYFPVDPFAAPEISGFAISNGAEDAVSCQSPSVCHLACREVLTNLDQDLDSDDQLWSPTCPTFSPAEQVIDMPASNRRARAMELEPCRRQSTLSKRDSVSTIASTPEIVPQDHTEPTAQSTPAMTSTRSKDSAGSTQPRNARNAAKRAAHNVIEKRYRTNMNAKFLALERTISGGAQKSTKGESASLKKSEILANAISYMQQLQEENKALHKEVSLLKQNCVPRGGWRNARRAEMNFQA